MQQSVHDAVPALAAPRFYLTGRQPIRPGAILLATVIAGAVLAFVLYALGRSGHIHTFAESHGAGRSTASGAPAHPDDKDDPNQIDTVYLGDPADAPAPARSGDHVSPVHPTILVHLPRFGDQVGLIPESPAGRLLYKWLAAFNRADEAALGDALPSAAPESAVAAQLELRHRTGGFNLLSAKEVQPGVLVFRLRDQTPAGNEALGTLQVRPDTNPAQIATFSLRAVPSPYPAALPAATPTSK